MGGRQGVFPLICTHFYADGGCNCCVISGWGSTGRFCCFRWFIRWGIRLAVVERPGGAGGGLILAPSGRSSSRVSANVPGALNSRPNLQKIFIFSVNFGINVLRTVGPGPAGPVGAAVALRYVTVFMLLATVAFCWAEAFCNRRRGSAL